MSKSKRQLSTKEIAVILGVNWRTPLRWANDHCPHSVRKGNKKFFNEEEVVKWLKEQGRTGDPGRVKTKEAIANESIERELKVEKLLKLRQERLIREGSLHDVAACLDLQVQKIHLVKGELLTIPRREAVRCVGKEAHEIEDIMMAAMVRVCRLFAGEVEEE